MPGATQAQYATPKRRLSDQIGSFTGIQKSFIENSKHLSLHARWLFIALRHFADNQDENLSMPSYDEIQELTGLHRRKISQGFIELIRTGWLKKTSQQGRRSSYEILVPERLTSSTGGTTHQLKVVPQGEPLPVPPVELPDMNKERACARAASDQKDTEDKKTSSPPPPHARTDAPPQEEVGGGELGRFAFEEYLAYTRAFPSDFHSPEKWADKAKRTGQWDRLVDLFQKGGLHERPRESENMRRLRESAERFGGAPKQPRSTDPGSPRRAIAGLPRSG